MSTQPFVLWANHPDRDQVRANLDALEVGGMTGRVVYAENAAGERVGKRDAGPWTGYLPYGVRKEAA